MTIDKIDQAGDISTLRSLKADEDPRTIEEMIADDPYEVVTVTAVEPRSEGGWYFITTDSGWSVGVKGAEPKVGDTVWYYNAGDVNGRHGWALNGKVIEWQTPWERFAERIKWLADHDRRQREEFAAQKAKLDAKYDALPAPLKARIDRFRAAEADFRVTSEAYEMAAVGDAPKIARAIAKQHEWEIDDNLAVDSGYADQEQIANAVKAFYDLPYEEQKALVPDLEPGHSGNTFGGAVALARAVLQGAEV